jgi:hypothetical protein
VRLQLGPHPDGPLGDDGPPDPPGHGEVRVADHADDLDAVGLPAGPRRRRRAVGGVVHLPVALGDGAVVPDLVANAHAVAVAVHGARHGDGLLDEGLPRQRAVQDHVTPLVQRCHQQRRRRVRRRLVHLV